MSNPNLCGARDTSTGNPCERTISDGSDSCGYHRTTSRAPQHAPGASVMALVAAQSATMELDDLMTSADLSVDQRMWKEMFWEDPETASRWLSHFPTYAIGSKWYISGFEVEDAVTWRESGFGPESSEWANVVGEKNPDIALAWLEVRGMTPNIASNLIDDGFSPELAKEQYERDFNATSEDVEKWLKLHDGDLDATQEWLRFSPNYSWGSKWYRNGWTPEEAEEWSNLGFNYDSYEWLSVVSENAKESLEWVNIKGMTPAAAKEYRNRGESPSSILFLKR